ncbi:hypothetical protein [Frigoribacterium faeni]|uniref:hypothetical protein n=1 Tax=Frigoribacterium faeni TaxID=145483 RepID=UPI00141A7C83|nr:hypothetical protein [Frigoribacterium faeni]NIJ04406.1 hypothetical protein [Frigoribacterium faeni]
MRLLDRSPLVRSTLGVVAAGALVFGLAACSSTSDSESNNTAPTHPTNATEPSEAASAEPLASIPQLTAGVDTQVAVDASFVDALGTLGLTPGVVGTATFTDGTFSFPITGGTVDYYDPEGDVRPYVQGNIDHDGSGLSLTAADGTVVELSDFRIDPGESELYGTVTVGDQIVAQDAFLFDLWGGTLQPLRMEGTNAVLEGTTVHVSSDAAELLNQTFGTEAVEDEMLVGVATITVATE